MLHDPIALQDVVKTIKSIAKTIDAESSVGINDIMLNMKELENAIKDIRSACTQAVEKHKYVLTDFNFISSETRSIEDHYALFQDMCKRWGYSPEDLFEAKAMSMTLKGIDGLLIKAIKETKSCPDDVPIEQFKDSCLKKFLGENQTVKSLRQIVRKA